MRSMKITPLFKNKMVVAIALTAVLSMNIALSEIIRVGAARPLSGTPLPTTIERHLKASVNITGNDEERMFNSLVSEIGKLKQDWFNEEVEILSKERGPNIEAFIAKCQKLTSNDDMVIFMRSEKYSNEADVAKFFYNYREDERIGRYCSPMLKELFEQWQEEGVTIQTIIPLLTSHLDRRVIDQQTVAIWKLYSERFFPEGDNWSLYNTMLKTLATSVPYAQLAPDFKRSSRRDDIFGCLYGALLKSELNEGKTPAMFRNTIEVTDFHDLRIKIWYDYVTLYIYKGSIDTARDEVVGEGDIYQTKFREYFESTFPGTLTTERGVKKMPEMLRVYWHRSGKDLLSHGKSYYDFMEKVFPSPKSST